MPCSRRTTRSPPTHTESPGSTSMTRRHWSMRNGSSSRMRTAGRARSLRNPDGCSRDQGPLRHLGPQLWRRREPPLHVARTIDTNRFDHTVVTLYPADHALRSQCGSMRRQFADAGVRVHDLGVPHPAGARGPRIVRLTNTATTLAAAIQKLRRLIISSRADVVDAHLETALYTAVPAAVSAGVPVSITLYSELDLWKILDSRSIRQFLFPAIRRLNL